MKVKLHRVSHEVLLTKLRGNKWPEMGLKSLAGLAGTNIDNGNHYATSYVPPTDYQVC